MKPTEGGVASRVMRRLPAIVAVLLLLLLFTGCKKANAEDAQMDEAGMMGLMSMGPAIAAMAVVPFFVIGGYALLIFFSFFDRREGRLGKNDMQIGTKLVMWGFILAGITMILGGANALVTYVLSGFKGGFAPIKGVLSSVITGVVVAGAVALLFLPRTNNSEEPQIERWAMGILGLITGLVAIFSLNDLIYSVFQGAGWRTNIAPALSRLAVFGAAGGFALMRHGGLSGWTAPVKPTMPSMPGGFPGGGGGQAGGGYPPQQGGGYPPQQGGGGYPPQGGGGYPPQGGGYPQGGGGYPPQGGGGYPPQGGGYGR